MKLDKITTKVKLHFYKGWRNGECICDTSSYRCWQRSLSLLSLEVSQNLSRGRFLWNFDEKLSIPIQWHQNHKPIFGTSINFALRNQDSWSCAYYDIVAWRTIYASGAYRLLFILRENAVLHFYCECCLFFGNLNLFFQQQKRNYFKILIMG